MRYCSKCGAMIDEAMRFCPSCGESVDIEGLERNETSKDEVKNHNNKFMAILSYFGILVLIPLLACKDSKYVRFHVNQGLLVFILEIIYAVGYNMLSKILLDISWELYDIVHMVSMVSIAFLVLSVIGILNAVNGKTKELPVIGKYRLLER
ncbi:zinc-ribbon domain-containing protein [[Clostridium] innocuum]|nr:zinc-ribbon domain-containing protein [[Clostridium] innocuum]MCR0577157.1 zinc-ribbon domain-containing protein [[Clostridium] innocuum]